MFHFSARRSRGPLIEIEQPAEPRTASHATRHLDHRRARDQPIVESLVIPFAVVVLDDTPPRPAGNAAPRSESSDRGILL